MHSLNKTTCALQASGNTYDKETSLLTEKNNVQVCTQQRVSGHQTYNLLVLGSHVVYTYIGTPYQLPQAVKHINLHVYTFLRLYFSGIKLGTHLQHCSHHYQAQGIKIVNL